MSLGILFSAIIACFFFIALYLWGFLEDSPKTRWIIAAAASLAIGIAGFMLTR